MAGRDNTGTELAITRLRPNEASKYWRVWVGEAGNLFLVRHDTDPIATPDGDWLASFETDGSGDVVNVVINPRRSLFGS